jgi:hypothetical protein
MRIEYAYLMPNTPPVFYAGSETQPHARQFVPKPSAKEAHLKGASSCNSFRDSFLQANIFFRV